MPVTPRDSPVQIVVDRRDAPLLASCRYHRRPRGALRVGPGQLAQTVADQRRRLDERLGAGRAGRELATAPWALQLLELVELPGGDRALHHPLLPRPVCRRQAPQPLADDLGRGPAQQLGEHRALAVLEVARREPSPEVGDVAQLHLRLLGADHGLQDRQLDDGGPEVVQVTAPVQSVTQEIRVGRFLQQRRVVTGVTQHHPDPVGRERRKGSALGEQVRAMGPQDLVHLPEAGLQGLLVVGQAGMLAVGRGAEVVGGELLLPSRREPHVGGAGTVPQGQLLRRQLPRAVADPADVDAFAQLVLPGQVGEQPDRQHRAAQRHPSGADAGRRGCDDLGGRDRLEIDQDGHVPPGQQVLGVEVARTEHVEEGQQGPFAPVEPVRVLVAGAGPDVDELHPAVVAAVDHRGRPES